MKIVFKYLYAHINYMPIIKSHLLVGYKQLRVNRDLIFLNKITIITIITIITNNNINN
jgi:hypothetical protein